MPPTGGFFMSAEWAWKRGVTLCKSPSFFFLGCYDGYMALTQRGNLEQIMAKFTTLPLGATFNNDGQVWEKVDASRAKPLGAGPSYAMGMTVCEVRECVPRYVITYQKPGDNRTLLGAAQGRHTYETQEQAQEQMDAIQSANNASRLEELGWINLEVRVCPCYPDHFDPQTVYFD